ncbi:MAG TPA: ABC transporter substrate-binding protein [Tepidisphaeraceae bacterium]|nr:ABC transporter substrate-binding protein [Tepidisphaeraceae bacterium]
MIFIAGVFAGCNRSEKPAQDKVELSILFAPDSTGVWRSLCADFEKQHPNIHVNLIEGTASTNGREDQYVTSFLSGQSPYDVIYADVTWVPKFAAGGWLEDLTDRWPADNWARFIPGVIEGSKYKGRIYRVPFDIGAGMLYYRKDLLDAAGEKPPETFDDLVRISKELQHPPSLWGFAWQGQQYEGLVCDYIEILKGFGGDWIDPATNAVGLDQPAAIQATTFLRDCMGKYGISPPGVATYDEEPSRQLFNAGRAVFMRNWPYAWVKAQAADSPIKGKIGITRVPMTPGGAHASTLGGYGFSISKSSPHKDQAWLLVQFLTQLPQAKQVYLNTGTLIAQKAFYDDNPDPAIQQMYQVFQTTVPRPMTPQYAQASDILQRHLSAALTGLESPEDAMKEAAKETRLLLPAASGKRAAE